MIAPTRIGVKHLIFGIDLANRKDSGSLRLVLCNGNDERSIVPRRKPAHVDVKLTLWGTRFHIVEHHKWKEADQARPHLAHNIGKLVFETGQDLVAEPFPLSHKVWPCLFAFQDGHVQQKLNLALPSAKAAVSLQTIHEVDQQVPFVAAQRHLKADGLKPKILWLVI